MMVKPAWMFAAAGLAAAWPPAVAAAGNDAALQCTLVQDNAMRLACEAAGMPINIYAIDPEEEPIACQACHLAEVKRPKIIVH